MASIQEDKIYLIIIIGMAGMFILAVSIVLFVLVYKKKIVEEQVIYQENLIQSAVAIQEEERKRFAADLHDQIGGSISTILLSLSGMESDCAAMSEKKILNKTHNIREQLNEVLRSIREISHNLTPNSLEHYGLVATLSDLCFQVQDSDQIDVEFTCDGTEERFEFSRELAIYRICRELITNTIKHAQASQITILLSFRDQKFELVYKDNGIGFLNNLESRGSGLKNIHSRAEVIHAQLSVDKNIKNGMEARLTLIR